MLSGLFALIVAALFTGAALYITLVEHPVRLQAEAAEALRHWKPSYARALPIQAALAIAGGVLGAGAGAAVLTDYWRWAAGAVVLLLNWPFTLLAIMPTNRPLKALDPARDADQARPLLRRWGAFHAVRSALGAAAVALFAWPLA